MRCSEHAQASHVTHVATLRAGVRPSKTGPGHDGHGIDRPGAQFWLKSKDRIESFPRESFRNFWWQEGRDRTGTPCAWGGEVVGNEGLVALTDLSNPLHRIIVEIILLDFRRVKAGIGSILTTYRTSPVRQFLSAEIAREVDHQRSSLSLMSRSTSTEEVLHPILTRGSNPSKPLFALFQEFKTRGFLSR